MNLLRTFLFFLALVFLVSASFLAGYLFHQQIFPPDRFPLLNDAYEILLNHGLIDPPTGSALEYGAIHGMVKAYGDPYTVFIEPAQHELESNALEGKYGGIGVQLEEDQSGAWILHPFPDSPASRSGILDGDRLLSVDELKITEETPIDAIQSAVRGKIGEKVKLVIGHPPEFKPVEVVIIREEIPLPSTTWHIDANQPQIGVIKVNLIAASTPDEIKKAVKELQLRGATHFVLDLRDNPGGLLTSGVEIARLFLKDGVVMQQQYRGRDIETYKITRPGPLADIPLAVLINQGSASAAEIAAGALKQHARAPLIGSRSYGKDTVQLVFSLKDDSSLHVTSARWWIPGLEPPIGGNGLQPDILVESSDSSEGSDPVLLAAIQTLLSK